MPEIQKSAVTDSMTVPPFSIGPTAEDIGAYRELIGTIDAGNTSLGFSPRTLAELTFAQIDRCQTDPALGVGTFINKNAEVDGLDERSRLRIGQERYIAGVLGLKLSPTSISDKNGIASFTATIPEDSEVPPVPPRNSSRQFMGPDGQPLRPVQRDMIFSSHFIAANRAIFSQQHVFEGLAYNVTQQAEGGMLTVGSHPSDPLGAMSLQRQIARVLGYEVDVYTKQSDGTYTMPISGIRKGFDNKNTHFKSKDGLISKDQLGL